MGLFDKKKKSYEPQYQAYAPPSPPPSIYQMEMNRDVTGLNECLIGVDYNRRWQSLVALGRLAEGGCFSPLTVPLLNGLLNDRNNEIRWNAAWLLGVLAEKGAHDRGSIPLLNPLLNDPESLVRGSAAGAISRFADAGIFEPSSLPMLKRLLADESPLNRGNAAGALGSLANAGACDPDVIPSLNSLLKDDDHKVCGNAALALEKMAKLGVYDPDSVPLLDRLKDDSNPKVNAHASKALIYIQAITDKNNQKVRKSMESAITLLMPSHIETGSQAEIVVKMDNQTSEVMQDISLDLSDMEEFFELSGEVQVKSLRPGMRLRHSVKMRAKFDEGVFPFKITVCGNGLRFDKEYSIKVGGTEIY